MTTPFTGQGSLYKTSPLAASARPLLMGKIPGHPAEPVAWVNLVGTSRVFYTSLGHPGDFDNASFRRLLRNAVFWALNRQPSATRYAGRNPESPPRPRRKPAVALLNRAARARSTPRRPWRPSRFRTTSQLDLVLAEPVVRQPVSLSFDERGRLWVVQYLQYPVPGRTEDGQPRRRLARRVRQGPAPSAPPLPRPRQDHDPRGHRRRRRLRHGTRRSSTG